MTYRELAKELAEVIVQATDDCEGDMNKKIEYNTDVYDHMAWIHGNM